MDQFMPKSMSVAKQPQIDIALAKMTATDVQPFPVVEDRGFRNYSKSLNPMYTIPSRKTLSNITYSTTVQEHTGFSAGKSSKSYCRLPYH